MALIIDPDDLTFEVVATTATGTTMISLITDTLEFELTIIGALSEDGVTGQAIYSKFKEIWRTNIEAIKFLFPMEGITPEQFEFINDWRPDSDATRKLLRTCGFAERDAGVIVQEWMGFISLGNIDAASKTSGDKAYYAFAGDVARTVFTYAGAVDEPVQIYGDVTNGNLDVRASVLTAYVREQGKTYGQITTTDIGVPTLTYIAYRFPLSEGTDLKIDETDGNISTLTPYTNMGIEYFAAPQASGSFLTSDLSGGPYNFHVVINPATGTAQEVYNFIQWSLRQDVDIDDGVGNVNGFLAEALAEYVGDTFKTLEIGVGGVALDADVLDSNDINGVVFVDDLSTERTFPFVAAGTLNFNPNLVGDSNPEFWMFFTTNVGGNFGTTNAIIVNDNGGSPLEGVIPGSSLVWDFDYDGNVQGGRTAAQDADVTVIAIGLDTGQYVSTTHTIGRSVGQSISLVAALERNYSNP